MAAALSAAAVLSPVSVSAAEAGSASMASGLASFENSGAASENSQPSPSPETEEGAVSTGAPKTGAGSQTDASADSQNTDSQDAASADSQASVSVMDRNQFLADIKSANEARAQESSKYTGSEVASMTNQEIADMNKTCCDAEKDLYAKYSSAVFSNKNLQYLCELYMKGLKNQFDAYDSWKTDFDITRYNELWDAGYSKRALALVEIADTYQIDIPNLDAMRGKAESLNKENAEGAETDLSSEEVKKAQDDLNTLGFENTADGNFGSRTSQLLHRFQVMYGYSPADGVLNSESLKELDTEAAKVLPTEAESETETEAGAS